MVDHLVETIDRLSTPPTDDTSFDEWLCAADGIELLKRNAQDDEFVFYATPGGTFIHSILVPASNVNPLDVEDLMAWSFNAYGTWGVGYSLADPPRVSLDTPFKNSGTKSFEGASRLIFPRHFEGRIDLKHYWEILQPFAHVFGLHFLEERSAYCRLDESGDIEDFVRIVTVRRRSDEFDTIIAFGESFSTNGCFSLSP